MIQNVGGQPILILPEGAMRTAGKDAQRVNIAAARAVADSVRTTLGPKGMDKMLVDGVGDIVISNDGVTILEEMEIEHPAAKMMVEVAKTQNEEVGDGTTTAVVIAGELLKKAEDLLEQDIHPIVIIKGYRIAKQKALEAVEKYAKPVGINDSEILQRIALTAMTGKGSEAAKEPLAKIAVDAVRTVAEKDGDKISIDMDNVKIEKAVGGSMDDSELIKGIVIDKEKVHSGMPANVKNAKIALLDTALEVKETETDAEIRITSPEQMQAFLEQEAKMLRNMVEKIVATGANVVFCQKGIDDVAQHYLAKKGIVAARRVKKSDMEKMAKATGGRIVSSLEDLSGEDLGFAGVVEEKKISGEHMIFVKDCKDPKAVTILVRGGTEHVTDEALRAMDDAVRGVAAAIEVGRAVSGGGAAEIEIARQLKEYAEKIGGREQLAINAFAEALEIIPRTLAESAGLDAIDTLVELRALHEKGKTTTGVDVINAKVSDMAELNVIEPLKIKTQALKSASEATEMILRIDDVISASKLSRGGGGMPSNPSLASEDD